MIILSYNIIYNITSGAIQYGRLNICDYDLFIVSANSLLVEKYDNLTFASCDKNKLAALNLYIVFLHFICLCTNPS